MTQMMLILALAVTVEGLVQYAKCIIDMIVKKEYKTTITQLRDFRYYVYRRMGRNGFDRCAGLSRGQLRGGCHQTPAECSARQSRSRKYKIKTNKSSPGMPGGRFVGDKGNLTG